jgi:high-affinity iron transporter
LGALTGLGVAAGIGVALFKWGIRINIRLFFQVMGVLLILVVAGLVVSSLSHFDSAVATLAQMDRKSEGLCFYYERFAKNPSCILGPMVWNTTQALPDDKFPGLLFSALFGYNDKLYVVQAISYVLFLLTIGGIYFRSITGRPSVATANGKSAQKPVSYRQE